VASLAAAQFWFSGAHAQTLVHFDLPAQSLARSLNAIGTATNTDVGFSSNQVAGFIAPAVKADLTVDGALVRVLAGTGLRPQHLDDHTIVITTKESSRSDSSEVKLWPAKASSSVEGDDQIAPPAGAVADSTESSPSSGARKKELDEIVVTGTNIRGVTSTASPTEIYTREDIDRTGLGTVASFIATLPQNFSNASENTISGVATGGTSPDNASGATGVNLRGLGNDATLVLINGRRLAPGGLNGDIVDVSLIPLAAVERVEVVTDGASAIYGSDAVGGVMNFILRQNYEGVETRARFGSVTDGSSHETQIGQIAGKTWLTGSVIGSYEYYDRTPLSGLDRSVSRNALQPFSLLPEQVRQSALLNLQQSLTAGIELYADSMFSHRTTYFDATAPGFSQHSPSDISSYSLDIGSRFQLSDGAEVELTASYANSETHYKEGDNLLQFTTYSSDVNSAILAFDAKVDGTIATVSAGPIRYAIGSQFRKESYNFKGFQLAPNSPVTESRFEPDRNIDAAFVEMRIPVIGPAAGTSGKGSFELSLADRFEHYSDFGSTNNPQIGVSWIALSSLKFRGTAGTSFKAPALYKLNPIPSQTIALPLPDPGVGTSPCSMYVGGTGNTCTNAMVAFGGSRKLGPEKARTWTIGFDLQPEALPGLRLNATYYNLHFTNRITDPDSILSYIEALQNQGLLGPSIVQRDPSLALVQQLAAYPTYVNFFALDLTTVKALVDYRSQNLATERTSGIDLDLGYTGNLFSGDFETGINATYILKLDNQFTAATPPVDNLNTPFNPINLRLRGRMEYQHAPLSAAAFVNFSNSYNDNRIQGATVPVASWTTIDMNVGYQLPEQLGIAGASKLLFGVTNIANREPPFLTNPGFGVNFDGTNANALGRFVYIQLEKQW
jgi:outer membrane cobalamin receptor